MSLWVPEDIGKPDDVIIRQNMAHSLRLFVAGIPRPQGSKRAFKLPTGKVTMVEASKGVKDWRSSIASAAQEAMQGRALLDGHLRLSASFLFERPQSHYRINKQGRFLRDNAPPFPTGKPDLSKLLRALEDALTGVAIHDDSRITTVNISKRYGGKPGVDFLVEPDDSPVPPYY